jgi:diaminopimelate epimerase
MKMEFFKYHGTGNDFIIVDNRQLVFDKSRTSLIANLCDRRFGIGADGFILLEDHKYHDFTMIYYNSDGNESSMCGNGGRCITHFAKFLGLITDKATFEAIDGIHHAQIENGSVRLQMQNVKQIEQNEFYSVIDTGSPHYVKLTSEIAKMNINESGALIRYSEEFAKKGINVNFVEKNNNDYFSVRTYERGVEAETLSCGTGVTAVALAMHYIGETEKNLITMKTEGGELQVAFDKNANGYENIWLIGPAIQVFKGELEW